MALLTIAVYSGLLPLGFTLNKQHCQAERYLGTANTVHSAQHAFTPVHVRVLPRRPSYAQLQRTLNIHCP